MNLFRLDQGASQPIRAPYCGKSETLWYVSFVHALAEPTRRASEALTLFTPVSNSKRCGTVGSRLCVVTASQIEELISGLASSAVNCSARVGCFVPSYKKTRGSVLSGSKISRVNRLRLLHGNSSIFILSLSSCIGQRYRPDIRPSSATCISNNANVRGWAKMNNQTYPCVRQG